MIRRERGDGVSTSLTTAARYELTHVTRYAYEQPVFASYGRAHLKPVTDAGQRCLESEVAVTPTPADVGEHVDYFGNTSTFFCVRQPHTTLTVTARSTIDVDRPAVALPDQPWEQVRAGLAAHPGAIEFTLPSPRIQTSDVVRAYAASVFTPGRAIEEALRALIDRVHGDFRYKPGSTTVQTTLPELFTLREGVCQDFAHLAVGCLRAVGLSARYVSGYLETQPPPGRPKLRGADASHAWVSVFVPGAGWVDIDPTNDTFIDSRYLVVGWGRDYGDVPPLKGVIMTDSRKSTMQVEVDVVRVG